MAAVWGKPSSSPFWVTTISASMDSRLRDRKSTRLNSSHTEIYTLSLHDALPICRQAELVLNDGCGMGQAFFVAVLGDDNQRIDGFTLELRVVREQRIDRLDAQI